MSALDPETSAEVRAAIDDLLSARLAPPVWDQLVGDLAAMRRALRTGDEHAARAALVPLTRAAFESKVRTRLGSRRAPAAVVVPTKRTPALPLVGAVCGVVLMALGWQLGGGLVLAGTGALALLVLGVAVAGMRVGAEPRSSAPVEGEQSDERVAAPPELRDQLGKLRLLAAD